MEKGWKRKTKYIQVMENNNLRHLKLNETLQLKNGWLVLAVPGGWIYSWMTIEIKIHGPSSTFPEIAIFVPKPLQVGLKK